MLCVFKVLFFFLFHRPEAFTPELSSSIASCFVRACRRCAPDPLPGLAGFRTGSAPRLLVFLFSFPVFSLFF